jgi:hypothetical protein
MDDHYKVSASPIPHLVTYPDSYPARPWAYRNERRDFETLLGVIEAHAITHQVTRARDDYGRIIASAADYEAARDILAEAFAVSSGKKVKDSVRRAVVAVDELGGEVTDVTVAQVAKHLKWVAP